MDERRSAPRVEHQIPVVVKERQRSFIVHTKNLSASGAYCTFANFVAPMTKLQVNLQLDQLGRPQTIACQGIVVRVNPPSFRRRCSAYDVAIFFNDLSDQDRTAIARYVLRHLRASTSG
ncbi:MAG: PilZ domain-containing protein [Candidatus Omnitrophica bacterium]|nr:PilZ domain-containing protein [Candidatus Omnitrophota bacterium]